MQHADIVHRCFRCGYCKFPLEYQDFNCPPYRQYGFDTYAAGGRMWLMNAWLNKEIKTSERLAHILYTCVACGNCKEQCVYKFKDFLLDIFIEAKSEMVLEGMVPPPVRDLFKAVSLSGNPYKAPQEERGRWAEGTGIQEYAGQEYLFYVGCAGSFDEIGQKMARSVGALLVEAGLSLGIMGPDETCDGNDVKAMGETWLFKELAKNNISKFNERRIKRVITLDPHAFNAFRHDYAQLGSLIETWHYSEILAGLVKEKALPVTGLKAKVTYHDPCYLGRYNQIYNAPRQVLRSIPGLELVEMERNGVNSFCCGGGGGNFFTDLLGVGEDSAARVRVREARETGADILAVACPLCARMLTDALKAEELDSDMEVVDIAEIVRRAR
ncbi:MAG: (Fe-S)-binding protein [Proteobacteria bacterium]|nr:(Fe-S)-binding protein [Pseudomonadota bacterium]